MGLSCSGNSPRSLTLDTRTTPCLSPTRSGAAGTGACKNFNQSVRFVHFLDKKMKDYLVETGEIFPDSDSARVLCEILDEDTMGRIDDQTDLKLTAYEPMRAWILQRDTKLKSRKATRHRCSAKSRMTWSTALSPSLIPLSRRPPQHLRPIPGLPPLTLGHRHPV